MWLFLNNISEKNWDFIISCQQLFSDNFSPLMIKKIWLFWSGMRYVGQRLLRRMCVGMWENCFLDLAILGESFVNIGYYLRDYLKTDILLLVLYCFSEVLKCLGQKPRCFSLGFKTIPCLKTCKKFQTWCSMVFSEITFIPWSVAIGVQGGYPVKNSSVLTYLLLTDNTKQMSMTVLRQFFFFISMLKVYSLILASSLYVINK